MRVVESSRTAIWPYAKLAFLIPAVLLGAGLFILADRNNLCNFGPFCGSGSNVTCTSGVACDYYPAGALLLVLWIIATGLA
jgi:hypothetical protein